MHVSDEVRDAAREFLRLWIELIKNAKMGLNQRIETSLFGSIKVGYDIGTIQNPTKLKQLEIHVKIVCYIADMNFDRTLAIMIS
jgi:hypothetical protein